MSFVWKLRLIYTPGIDVDFLSILQHILYGLRNKTRDFQLNGTRRQSVKEASANGRAWHKGSLIQSL